MLLENFLLGLCINASCHNDEQDSEYNVTNIEEHLENSYQHYLHLDYLENQIKNEHFRIATVQNGILSSAIQVNGVWVGQGLAFKLLDILQEQYKFNYTVVVPKESGLGTKKSGIFGMLNNNEVDMAVAFLPITSAYWKYAHFSAMLDLGEWVAVLKRPKASNNLYGIAAPFDSTVWILILISLLILGPIIYLTVLLHEMVSFNEKRSMSLCNCTWFVYGALLKQGTALSPMSDVTRIAFATWWLFVTIIIAFYTANLTAFLTLSKFTLPIKETKDIGDKKYNIVSTTGSIIEASSIDPVGALYTSFKAVNKVFVEDDGLKILDTWVTNKNYIYIAERPNIDILLYEDFSNRAVTEDDYINTCPYVVTPWCVYKRPRSFAYSKNFKYGVLLDMTLRTLVEVGLVKYFMTQQLPGVGCCPINLKDNKRQLINTDLLLIYYIMATGFVLAIIIFIIEVILQIPKRRKNSKPLPYTSCNVVLNNTFRKKQYINGREYWVIKSPEGYIKLIPLRSPSALLFYYTWKH